MCGCLCTHAHSHRCDYLVVLKQSCSDLFKCLERIFFNVLGFLINEFKFVLPHTFSQNPLLDGRELASFIQPVSLRPGSKEPSSSMGKWQKSGVSKYM